MLVFVLIRCSPDELEVEENAVCEPIKELVLLEINFT